MKTIYRLLLCTSVALGVTACDLEEDAGDGGGPDMSTGLADANVGAGGMGGAGGAGAAGGEGGAGGLGGEGGGAGGMGGEGGEGGVGGGPLSCPDFDTPRECNLAQCHWYEDRCNDEPQAGQCDQPDPASCEAAGCDWTDAGCEPRRMACEELAQGVCTAREDCRWFNNHCETDPSTLSCDQLDAAQCANRNECAWDGRSCVVRPDGDCAELNEDACLARPDCEALYSANNGGGAPGERAAPGPPQDPDGEEPQDPPENPFEGCQERGEVQCENVPINACEQTPGCHVEVDEGCEPCDCPPGAECKCEDICEAIARCVDDEAAPCADLDEQACDQDPRCQPNWIDECDGNGFGDVPEGGPDGDAFFPCQQRFICEERAQPQRCEEIRDVNQCADTQGCEPVFDDCGGCGGGPEPFPCDCADGEDCACAQPAPPICDEECFRCQAEQGDRQCEELDPEECEDRFDCHIEFQECGGGGPDGDPVDCPIAPMCVSNDQPRDCNDIGDQNTCWDSGCFWYEDGMGAFPAPCDEDGCADPLPQDGFCGEPPQNDACGQLGRNECENRDDCQLEVFDGMCECNPGEPCPDFCEEDWICTPREQRECGAFGPDECEAHMECQVEWVDVPCGCNPEEPDCEQVDCEPQPICVPREERRCEDLGPDECEGNMECQLEWLDVPCACDPADEACDFECEPQPFCSPRERECRDLGPGDCEDDPRCELDWDGGQPPPPPPECPPCPEGEACECEGMAIAPAPMCREREQANACSDYGEDQAACEADPRCHAEERVNCADVECPPGEMCDVPCFQEFVCEPNNVMPGGCFEDADCDGGTCWDGLCVADEPGDACAADVDCGEGGSCWDGWCVMEPQDPDGPACMADDQCADGSPCENGRCGG